MEEFMKWITINNIDNWGACDRADGKRYSDENILKLTSGRSKIKPLSVFDLNISEFDKLWLLLRVIILGEEGIKEVIMKSVAEAYQAVTDIRKHHTTTWYAQKVCAAKESAEDAKYMMKWAMAHMGKKNDSNLENTRKSIEHAARFSCTHASWTEKNTGGGPVSYSKQLAHIKRILNNKE